MNNQEIPQASKSSLVKASIVAVFIAAVALIGFILPAEYNIDPTGLGKSMGLTQLNSETPIKPSSEQAQAQNQASSNLEYRTDKVVIKVAAGKGLEYKFFLEEHGRITYSWKTAGELIYFDFHGEPQGDTTGFFESFSLSTASSAEGTLTTPFAGSHGWYWKNNSEQEIVITLKTKGYYKVIGLK